MRLLLTSAHQDVSCLSFLFFSLSCFVITFHFRLLSPLLSSSFFSSSPKYRNAVKGFNSTAAPRYSSPQHTPPSAWPAPSKQNNLPYALSLSVLHLRTLCVLCVFPSPPMQSVNTITTIATGTVGSLRRKCYVWTQQGWNSCLTLWFSVLLAVNGEGLIKCSHRAVSFSLITVVLFHVRVLNVAFVTLEGYLSASDCLEETVQLIIRRYGLCVSLLHRFGPSSSLLCFLLNLSYLHQAKKLFLSCYFFTSPVLPNVSGNVAMVLLPAAEMSFPLTQTACWGFCCTGDAPPISTNMWALHSGWEPSGGQKVNCRSDRPKACSVEVNVLF